jgi:formylglycine-generating enzyme required for sulfatase activity
VFVRPFNGFENGTAECESVNTGPLSSEKEPSSPSDQPVWTIGRFQILEKLGQGGVGVVYRAYDSLLERTIALKVPLSPPEDEEAAERFLREGRAAAALDHPNIVRIFEIGQADGKYYIAAEFVDGQPLSNVVKGGRVSHQQAAWIVREVAAALAYAHEEGVIHRDVKPQNILIDPQGRPKLADFGLAKRVDRDATVTDDGSILGSPAYMSPEQARGERASKASDQYSLGVVLFELLVGRPPYTGNQYAVLLQVANATPASPSSEASDVPEGLDAICRRCTSPDPQDRYPDVSHLAADLDNWLEGRPLLALDRQTLDLETVQSAPALAPGCASSRRTGLRWALTAGFLAVNVILLLTWLWFQFADFGSDYTAVRPVAEHAGSDKLAKEAAPSIKERADNPPSTDVKTIRNSIGMDLVFVPAGRFLMGSPEDEYGRRANEKALETVVVDRAFYLAKFETTRAQFAAFVEATRYETQAEKDGGGVHRLENGKWIPMPNSSWRNPGFSQSDNDPVVGVSALDAVHFCEWLSYLEKQRYRLPTEAEWEYACRAGAVSPWSHASTEADVVKVANVHEYRSRSSVLRFWTLPVGRFPPNSFGLCDMHGNVAEWCMESYGHAVAGELGIRGGSWATRAVDARSASRRNRPGSFASNDVGFRVLRLVASEGETTKSVVASSNRNRPQPLDIHDQINQAARPTTGADAKRTVSSNDVTAAAQPSMEDPERWFEEKFGGELKRALTSKQKVELAVKMFMQLQGLSQDQLAFKRVLARHFLQLTAELRNTAEAWRFIEYMAHEGAVDELQSKTEFLKAVAAYVSEPSEIEIVAALALELVRYAVIRERFDVAADLAQTAELLAARLDGGPLTTRARQTADHLGALQGVHESSSKNIAGRALYLCFGPQDWTTGLELLAKSGHPASVVARVDVAAKASQELVECAQLWLDYASDAADVERVHFALRAAELLNRAQKMNGGRPLDLKGKRVQSALASVLREAEAERFRFDRLYSRRWLPGFFSLTNCKVIRHHNPYKSFRLDSPTKLRGVPGDSGVFMHPPSNSIQQVVYALPAGYVEMTGWAGLSDLGDAPAKIPSPVVFSIHAGNVVHPDKETPLWSSGKISATGMPVPFSVSITGLKEVTLTTQATGKDSWARACFADVYLQRVPRHLAPK